MKGVAIGRGVDGRPVWQAGCSESMSCVGLRTRPCEPRRPFTKGRVGRLVRLVRTNLPAGGTFVDATDLNAQALDRRARQPGRYRRAVGCVPAKTHAEGRVPACAGLEQTDGVAMRLCPRRRIGLDGLASHEGRGFGAPHWCPGKACRVDREGGHLHACSEGLSRGPAVRPVTWGRKGGFRDDQGAAVQPVELPAAEGPEDPRRLRLRPHPRPRRGGAQEAAVAVEPAREEEPRLRRPLRHRRDAPGPGLREGVPPERPQSSGTISCRSFVSETNPFEWSRMKGNARRWRHLTR